MNQENEFKTIEEYKKDYENSKQQLGNNLTFEEYLEQLNILTFEENESSKSQDMSFEYNPDDFDFEPQPPIQFNDQVDGGVIVSGYNNNCLVNSTLYLALLNKESLLAKKYTEEERQNLLNAAVNENESGENIFCQLVDQIKFECANELGFESHEMMQDEHVPHLGCKIGVRIYAKLKYTDKIGELQRISKQKNLSSEEIDSIEEEKKNTLKVINNQTEFGKSKKLDNVELLSKEIELMSKLPVVNIILDEKNYHYYISLEEIQRIEALNKEREQQEKTQQQKSKNKIPKVKKVIKEPERRFLKMSNFKFPKNFKLVYKEPIKSSQKNISSKKTWQQIQKKIVIEQKNIQMQKENKEKLGYSNQYKQDLQNYNQNIKGAGISWKEFLSAKKAQEEYDKNKMTK